MYRIGLILVCAASLSACALSPEHRVTWGYINATHVLNACLIEHPNQPDACNAQRAALTNARTLYTDIETDRP